MQDLGFDYSDAETFGKLEVLIPAGVSPDNYARAANILRKKLWDQKFCRDDYLLCSGAPSLLMQAAVEASRLCMPLRVLLWERQLGGYIERSIV